MVLLFREILLVKVDTVIPMQEYLPSTAVIFYSHSQLLAKKVTEQWEKSKP
jgi:hypothetical protein